MERGTQEKADLRLKKPIADNIKKVKIFQPDFKGQSIR